MGSSYSRKISADEAAKSALFVDAKSLKMFPDLGKEFKIKVGKKVISAHVNAVPCLCQGPEKPHDHYFLHFFSPLQFKKGQKIKISKNSKQEFEMKISN